MQFRVQEENLRHFQLEMLRRHRIPGILPVVIRQQDTDTLLQYETEGLVTLGAFLSNRMSTAVDLVQVLRRMLMTISEANGYFQNASDYLFHPERIYVDKGSRFVYMAIVPEASATNGWQAWVDCVKDLACYYVQSDSDFPWSRIFQLIRQAEGSFSRCLEAIELYEEELQGSGGHGDLNMLGGKEGDHGLQEGLVTGGELYKEDQLVEVADKNQGVSILDQLRSLFQRRSPASDYGQQINDPLEMVVKEQTVLLSSSPAYFEFDNGDQQNFKGQHFKIGRQPGMSQVVVEDPAVGRVHGELVMEEKDWYYKDLNTKNGTQLNSEALQPNQWERISDGDVLQVGHSKLKIHLTK